MPEEQGQVWRNKNISKVGLNFQFRYFFFLAHPCEYPRIPLNGNRTCYEDDEGVVCQFFCLDGYTFAIEPAKQYTCAFDNKWEPADKIPISDCTGIHNLIECQPNHIHYFSVGGWGST